MEIKRKFLLASLMVFLPAALFSQKNTFSQKIEWKSNANALEYKVEIQNIAGQKSQFITTDKNSAEISLEPGNYRYRVYAYDFLGREAGVSSWTNFDVFKASEPKIINIEKNVVVSGESAEISINVRIDDVNSNSTYELVSESLHGSVDASEKKSLGTGSETGSISRLNFRNVPPGKWRLKVTNASGLSSLSDIIEIKDDRSERNLALAEESLAKERLAFEEERRKFETERKKFEEEKKSLEKKPEVREEKPVVQEKKVEEKVKEPRGPYVYQDLIFEWGVISRTYPRFDHGRVKDYTGKSSASASRVSIAYLPKKTETNKFGFQIGVLSQGFDGSEPGYHIELDFSVFDFWAVWQHRLSKKISLAVKGGVGVAYIEESVIYNYLSDTRESPGYKDFYYPTLGAGASLFFTPWKFIVLEAGLDYNYVVAKGMHTGLLTPYACVGFRF